MALNRTKKEFDIFKFLLTLPGILLVYSAVFTIFFLLRLEGGNNPIALQLGSLTFRWYGIVITVGVVFALFIAQYLAERRGEDPNHAWGMLPFLLVFGILFARLWYVINTWEKYKDYLYSFGDPQHPGFFEVWRGGIAIQGAVIGGIIAALIYRQFTGIKFMRWADFIVPGLIVAQAMGRWGNFFNNEAYGSQTDLPWGLKIPCEYRTSGVTPGTVNTTCQAIPADSLFHPTFFYESIWDYAVFITLLFMVMYPKRVQRALKIRLRDGDIFLAYLVFYSIGRFIVEAMRTDSLYIIGDPVSGGIRSAQMLSIVSIFIGSVWFIWRHRAHPTRDDEALSVRVAPRQLVTDTVDDEAPQAEDSFEEDADGNNSEAESAEASQATSQTSVSEEEDSK
ncbi:MAG: prolipoprotein diacylglyceryl transferase [Chloroflexi bacterium]|uniref:Phosphatidylglycerol--prolipoprotein diacylglyceryl transferase n=1 Tax=Candidatus Chlorohelix allophototropha TaxID=3003348 RepID=A0A8T7M8P9_9CHLR|nr:prolipoprotein diacylglyceryl transferase [Chloroflexota bacterium]WJW68469.1 prolipoprotein diacylglyceryl transferase [Chloroflexota bacterium L227-S17]